MTDLLDTLKMIVSILNSLTPPAIIGGLVFIIYHLVAKKGRVRAISDNHLSGLPTVEANIAKLVDLGEGQKRATDTMLSNQSKMLAELSYLRGRLNGRDD